MKLDWLEHFDIQTKTLYFIIHKKKTSVLRFNKKIWQFLDNFIIGKEFWLMNRQVCVIRYNKRKRRIIEANIFKYFKMIEFYDLEKKIYFFKPLFKLLRKYHTYIRIVRQWLILVWRYSQAVQCGESKYLTCLHTLIRV